MSFWSHNPELLDEIITENLPEPWKTQVIEGEILVSDLPDDVLYKATIEGEREFWADQIDQAKMRVKEDRLRKAIKEEETDLI